MLQLLLVLYTVCAVLHTDMKEMALALLLLLGLLCWPLVNSQSYPYVSFRGQTLDNHSYVDLSLVRGDYSGSDSVQCHTDLSTCCTGTAGSHRGDWYFPNGTRLWFSHGPGGIFESRGSGRVDLRRRNNANSPFGIYRCDIAVRDYNSLRDTVYVGLYTASGGKIYNNTATHKCIHFCKFVYVDFCNNSILMTSENGSNYSVTSLPVLASSQLSLWNAYVCVGGLFRLNISIG